LGVLALAVSMCLTLGACINRVNQVESENW